MLEPQGSHCCHSCSHRDIPCSEVAFILPASWGSALGGHRGSQSGSALISRGLCPAASCGPASRQGHGVFTMPTSSLRARNFIIPISVKTSLKRQVSRCGYEFQVLMQASPLGVLCWKVLSVCPGRKQRLTRQRVSCGSGVSY